MSASVQLKNQKGQAVTEAVLLMVLFMGVTLLVANFMKDEEVLKRLVQSPFQHIAGMLQNGVWAPHQTSAAIHPNSHGRHVSIIGEPGR